MQTCPLRMIPPQPPERLPLLVCISYVSCSGHRASRMEGWLASQPSYFYCGSCSQSASQPTAQTWSRAGGVRRRPPPTADPSSSQGAGRTGCGRGGRTIRVHDDGLGCCTWGPSPKPLGPPPLLLMSRSLLASLWIQQHRMGASPVEGLHHTLRFDFCFKDRVLVHALSPHHQMHGVSRKLHFLEGTIN